MYCTNCGTERPDNATSCAKCGQKVPFFAPAESVPNYLVQSILVTLCCCLPFGVVALIYASQVNTKLAAGDIAGARESSGKAKTWVIVSVVLGIIGAFASIALNFMKN